jgi:hypothetical protein
MIGAGSAWELPGFENQEVNLKAIGLLLLVIGMSGAAMADLTAPEIDPSSGVSVLALVSGALLVIRGSRKR